MRLLLAPLAVASLALASSSPAQWTGFRGPNGQGTLPSSRVPAKLTEEHVRWRVPVGGKGHGSPVLWKDVVYLTRQAANANSNEREVVAFDRATGEEQWIHTEDFDPVRIHRFNSFASSTPEVDDDGLYVAWTSGADLLAFSLDHEGAERWRVTLGTHNSQHGSAYAPLLVGDTLIVANDHQREGSFVVGLDTASGEERWRLEREPANERSAYVRPILYTPAAAAEQEPYVLLASTAYGLSAIRPQTGESLWDLELGFKQRCVGTPALLGDLVFIAAGAGGSGRECAVVRLPDTADGEPEVVHRPRRNLPYVPCALAFDDRFLTINDGGIASCLDAASGEVHWRGRLDATFFSSPVSNGDVAWIASREGELLTLALRGDDLDVVNRLDLGALIYATPALDDEHLFVRTAEHLLCLGGAGDDPVAAATPSPSDRAAAWLGDVAVPLDGAGGDEATIQWPIDADGTSPRFATPLYNGSTGVVLFLLEHARVRDDAASRALALAGGRALVAQLDAELDGLGAGLYTGLAGLGFTFGRLHASFPAEAFDAAERRCVEHLLATASRGTADTASWGAVTDVIGGDAGVGLYLLDVASRHADDAELTSSCLELARCAGHDLLARGTVDADGRRSWPMSPTFPRRMPNFSHGTAGIAFFLARLFEVTGDTVFLDGAVAGAAQLLALTGDDGLVYHDTDQLDLDYLGWCHGPPGTSRLFAQLDRVAPPDRRDPRWRRWIDGAVAAVLAAGVPERRTPGFWENHGRCCGTAGVAEFLLDLDELGLTTARPAAHAERMLDAVVAAGTARGDGLTWTGCEHRVRPELRTTQTGLMQGAAGIGLALLRRERGPNAAPRLRLPDELPAAAAAAANRR